MKEDKEFKEDRQTSERPKRESRYDSRRAAELRAAELRAKPRMTSSSIFDYPLKAPDGWVYAWIRTHFSDGGEPDVKRDSEIKFDGWDPVPADRHPELCLEGVSGMLAKQHNVISFMGLLLVQLPEIIHQERQQKAAFVEAQKVNDLQMKGILMGTPTMPFHNQSENAYRYHAQQVASVSTPPLDSRTFAG